MDKIGTLGLGILLLALAVGCSSGDTSSDTPDANNDANAGGMDTAALFLEAKPEGAKPLASIKESAKVGDQVAFEARVGGRGEPFVDNRAVMVVIDPSLPSCKDRHGDVCPIPWDYCCEAPESLVANTATVQWVGDDGTPQPLSLKGQGGLAELAWITVVGEVTMKDDSGLFVVNAKGVFLEKQG